MQSSHMVHDWIFSRITAANPANVQNSYALRETLVVAGESGMMELWQYYSITQSDQTASGYNILTIK